VINVKGKSEPINNSSPISYFKIMIIIGERINSSRSQIAQAIVSGNARFIQDEAKSQVNAGAAYIDINAGSFIGEEAKYLIWLLKVVQECTDTPLCIDSPDQKVIEEVLPITKANPMINSITLEPNRLNGILPLVKEYKSKVIALCQTQDTIAESTEEKVGIAGQLVEKVTGLGVPLDDLYIDPLIYPIGASTESAKATLGAIEQIMEKFPGVHTTCGLTNISYGLPYRRLVNRTFLVAAICRGLDSAILDPTDKQLYGSLKAALMLMGKDDFCMGYISAFKEDRLA
jgi:cobalamin-dependent methionine synthase I